MDFQSKYISVEQALAMVKSGDVIVTGLGASNFLSLNWGLFKDYPTDLDRVAESFMHILNAGIFTEKTDRVSSPEPLPIHIELEFDDDEKEDGEEDDLEVPGEE